MHSTIENWIDDLVADVDEAKVSEEFQEWLDIQSQFHDYSHRNTLLITLQCPQATTKIAGYNTWRNEFDRHVQEGEDAIWIWAPIITKQCPECENSQSYHEQKATVSTTRRRPTSGRTDWSGSSQPLCSTSPRPRANHYPS